MFKQVAVFLFCGILVVATTMALYDDMMEFFANPSRNVADFVDFATAIVTFGFLVSFIVSRTDNKKIAFKFFIAVSWIVGTLSLLEIVLRYNIEPTSPPASQVITTSIVLIIAVFISYYIYVNGWPVLDEAIDSDSEFECDQCGEAVNAKEAICPGCGEKFDDD